MHYTDKYLHEKLNKAEKYASIYYCQHKQLVEKLEAIEKLHQEVKCDCGEVGCYVSCTCGEEYPCPTVLVLGD